MGQFRKLPVEVEAVRLDEKGFAETPAWLLDALDGQIHRSEAGGLLIPTLEGPMMLLPGNWLVRGIRGEIYPVRGDIFAETYEAVR